MLNKVIVLGMDNTGKTTLCQELSELLGYEHVNSLGPKVSYEEMANFLKEKFTSEEPMVFERLCFFEEMVYGPILRGESKFHWDDPYSYILRDSAPIIVYCRPPMKRIFNFGDREQMEGVIEQKEKLLLAFDDLYFSLSGNGFLAITYDFETCNAKQLANFIITQWRGR